MMDYIPLTRRGSLRQLPSDLGLLFVPLSNRCPPLRYMYKTKGSFPITCYRKILTTQGPCEFFLTSPDSTVFEFESVPVEGIKKFLRYEQKLCVRGHRETLDGSKE